jgi:hypothetical protein
MNEDNEWWPSRYGAGDQLGALNEITPAKTAGAAQLVRRGITYDLGRTLHADVPRFEGRYWQQSLVSAAHLINRRKPGGSGGWGANQINWITELVTGTLQIGTHLDGLNHLQIGDRFYNGWRAEEIIEDWGTSKLGIETVPPIVTRGAAVVAEGVHMCSVMRGVKKANAKMITSAMRGVFRSDPRTRAEFMGHVDHE